MVTSRVLAVWRRLLWAGSGAGRRARREQRQHWGTRGARRADAGRLDRVYPADMGSAKEAHVEVGGRSVRISSPDKLYFPEAGLSKLDIATYYAAVADAAFHASARRPTALNR